MKYLIIIVAVAIMFLPSPKTEPVNPVDPDVTPVVVTGDTLDTCNATYRVLMAETWEEFGSKRDTFKNEEEALAWINEHQTATWTAAFTPFTEKATTAAKTKEGAIAFANAVKEKKL